METETIPSGTRWDNVRSLLLGAYTKQGAGVSKYSQRALHGWRVRVALSSTKVNHHVSDAGTTTQQHD
eukprot:5294875-Amphidinium_carterae.1